MTAPRLFFLCVILAITGCERLVSNKCSEMPYASLDSSAITSFSIFDNLADSGEQRALTSSNDRARTARLVQFLSEHNRDWWAPITGVPVGRLRVVLYDDSRRIAALSIGPSFIEGQGCSYFFIRTLSKDEMDELSEILAFEFKFD